MRDNEDYTIRIGRNGKFILAHMSPDCIDTGKVNILAEAAYATAVEFLNEEQRQKEKQNGSKD